MAALKDLTSGADVGELGRSPFKRNVIDCCKPCHATFMEQWRREALRNAGSPMLCDEWKRKRAAP